MHFIKLTSTDKKGCMRFIDVAQIKAIDGFDGFTNIYVGDPAHFKVKESPEEIFRLIREVLSSDEHLFVHYGSQVTMVASNQGVLK